MPEDSKLDADQQIILEGVSEADVLSRFENKQQGVDAINVLLAAHRLVLLTSKDGTRYYRLQEEVEASKRKGLSSEEALVHQEIGKTQSSGIWTKDLRKRTGLSQPIVARAIKTLESKQLIKAVKSVNYANRKYYMLFNLEPSQQVTGGAWYTDHDFDQVFIDVLYTQCFEAIRHLGSASIEEIAEAVTETKVINSDVPLTPQDWGAVVQTLVYDGRIELDPEAQEDEQFRVARLPPQEGSVFAAVPCGICPVRLAADKVIDECTPGGHISPSNCIYMDKWLEY